MKTHGHIIPRRDGTKDRCGGPTICIGCAKEALANLDAGTLPVVWMARFSLWTLNRLQRLLEEGGPDRRS